MNSLSNPLPLADVSLYLDSFPKSPELFDFGFVISDWLSRINTVKLLNDFNDNKAYLNHCGKETLSNYSKILTSFHNTTRTLFKLQATINLQSQRSSDIVNGDFYYFILFECHQLWTDFGTEIKQIFTMAIIYVYDYLHAIITGPKSEKGEYLLLLIKANDKLPLIIHMMEQNINVLIENIKSAEEFTSRF